MFLKETKLGKSPRDESKAPLLLPKGDALMKGKEGLLNSFSTRLGSQKEKEVCCEGCFRADPTSKTPNSLQPHTCYKSVGLIHRAKREIKATTTHWMPGFLEQMRLHAARFRLEVT